MCTLSVNEKNLCTQISKVHKINKKFIFAEMVAAESSIDELTADREQICMELNNEKEAKLKLINELDNLNAQVEFERNEEIVDKQVWLFENWRLKKVSLLAFYCASCSELWKFGMFKPNKCASNVFKPYILKHGHNQQTEN